MNEDLNQQYHYNTKIDREQAQTFLEALFGNLDSGYIEIRPIFNRTSEEPKFYRSIKEIEWNWISKLNTFQYNIFFGVCARKNKQGTKDSVKSIPALFADLDGKDFPGGKPEAKAQLDKLPPYLQPSIIVDSGHGYQCYWLLQEVYEIENEAEIPELEGYIKGIRCFLSGDAVQDLSRVLRLPGTINWKYPQNPVSCQIEYFDLSRKFDPIDFEEYWMNVNETTKEVELPSELPKIELNDLKVSKEIKGLIVDGNIEGKYKSRSEADEAAITALLRAGHDEATVKAVFENSNWGIGEKYREKGRNADKYLAHSIAKAEAFLAQQSNSQRSSQSNPESNASKTRSITIDGKTYCEKDDKLVIVKPGQDTGIVKTLSSFTIEPTKRIWVNGQSEMLEATLSTKERQYPNVLFRREDWNSKQRFLSNLPSVDLQFFGSDSDVQAILALVTQEKLPSKKGTPILGRNGDVWVLRDGVLSSQGWIEDPDIVYLPSEIDFDRRILYKPVDDLFDFCRKVLSLLPRLNEGKIIFPIIGWFFASPFAPLIREELGHFPILVLWGTHGSGKSSLLKTFWQLFGIKSEAFSSTETQFTFLRLFSGTNSIPIIIDEFKPWNMEEGEVRLLIRLLKRLYDGEVEHRGRPDLSVVPYTLQAPVAIAGEVSPCSLESALTERVIQVSLDPKSIEKGAPHEEAFNCLNEFELQAFAEPYIQWSLSVDVVQLLNQARRLLPSSVNFAPSRVRDNLQVMVTGLLAMRSFAEMYGIHFNEEAFKRGITESSNSMIDDLLGKGRKREIGLTIFLKNLATMAATARIKRGIHYDVSDTILYIALPDCIAEFRKFVRETNARVEVLDEKTYRRQISEVHEQGGYILETTTTHFFKVYESKEGENGRVRRCVAIDMEKLPFDASGFE